MVTSWQGRHHSGETNSLCSVEIKTPQIWAPWRQDAPKTCLVKINWLDLKGVSSEHTCQREMWSEWVGSKVEKLAPYVDISGYWMRWLSARRGINHQKGSIFVTIFTRVVNYQHHQKPSSQLSLSPSPLNWCDIASQGLKAGAGAQGSAVALLAKTLLACKLAHVARNWKPRGAKFKPFWHFGKNVFCFQPGLPREISCTCAMYTMFAIRYFDSSMVFHLILH